MGYLCNNQPTRAPKSQVTNHSIIIPYSLWYLIFNDLNRLSDINKIYVTIYTSYLTTNEAFIIPHLSHESSLTWLTTTKCHFTPQLMDAHQAHIYVATHSIPHTIHAHHPTTSTCVSYNSLDHEMLHDLHPRSIFSKSAITADPCRSMRQYLSHASINNSSCTTQLITVVTAQKHPKSHHPTKTPNSNITVLRRFSTMCHAFWLLASCMHSWWRSHHFLASKPNQTRLMAILRNIANFNRISRLFSNILTPHSCSACLKTMKTVAWSS